MAVLRKNCNLKAFFHFLHLGNSEILGSKTDLISREQNINIQKKNIRVILYLQQTCWFEKLEIHTNNISPYSKG